MVVLCWGIGSLQTRKSLRFGVSSFGYLSVVDTSSLPSPILISKEKWAYWSLKSGKARPDGSGRLTVKMSNFLVSSLFCREGTISIAKLSWRQYCCCCKYFFIKRLLWPIPLLHGTKLFQRWEVRFPSSQPTHEHNIENSSQSDWHCLPESGHPTNSVFRWGLISNSGEDDSMHH